MKNRPQLIIVAGLGILVLGVLLALSLSSQQQTISPTPVASPQPVTPGSTEFVPTQKTLGPSEITVTPPSPSEPTLPPDALAMDVASTATSSPIPPSLTPTPTASPTVTPIAITSQDDVPMVQIPAGEFIMGISHRQVSQWLRQIPDDARLFLDDTLAYAQSPQLTVRLEAYAIDKFETTMGRYRRCVQAGICQPVGALQTWSENYPVVGVTWYDADTYCRWVGKRLPNEAEWEKAARGTDGRWYPWGNDWAENRANRVMGLPQELKPVGSYPEGTSPYGVLDMGGNAAEWTADWFEPYPEQPNLTLFRDSQRQQRVARGILRGGLTEVGGPVGPTVSRMYDPPDTRIDSIGFRCVQGPTSDWRKLVLHTSMPHITATLTPDLSQMVYVPAGEFIMGTTDEESYDAQPPHIVYLDAYYIDKYEVTVPEFAAFLSVNGGHILGCGGYPCSDIGPSGGVGISGLEFVQGQYQIAPEAQHWAAFGPTWYGARDYCNWVGKRLPSEAEWEKAARGTDGRKYPWGNDWNPDWAAGGKGVFPSRPPVEGQYPTDTSPYGAVDMLGNVGEWVLDWFDKDYYAHSPYANPVNGKSNGRGWVVRGNIADEEVGLTFRRFNTGPGYMGFRCVYVPPNSR